MRLAGTDARLVDAFCRWFTRILIRGYASRCRQFARLRWSTYATFACHRLSKAEALLAREIARGIVMLEQMLSRYDADDTADRQHALREVMQEIALAGLFRGGFFDQAAFYGGTCLRIFYGLTRFSEDLDFSLLKENDNFSFAALFPQNGERCRT